MTKSGDRLLTVEQARVLMGLSKARMYQLIHDPENPIRVVPFTELVPGAENSRQRYFIKHSEVERYMSLPRQRISTLTVEPPVDEPQAEDIWTEGRPA